MERLSETIRTSLLFGKISWLVPMLLAGTMLLGGCGGGGGGNMPLPKSYSIGGTVSGLGVGAQVVLLDNGGDSMTVSENGTFVFSSPLASGASYAVTVSAAPSGESCIVSNSSGTVGSSNVSTVSVSCSTAYTIGGLVTGLGGGSSVVLLNNGGGSLTVSANGLFSFAAPLVSGATYAVTVGTEPTGEACTVSNGSGTVASAVITNVIVICEPSPISGANVLLELGHTAGLFDLQMTATRLLSEDNTGHWILWNATTDAILAKGNSSCLTTRCNNAHPTVGNVALISQTMVIETSAALEICAASDGHVVATIPGPISWWTLASDGSYVAAGTPNAVQAWSPTGQQLFSLPGDYATAVAYAAPRQIEVAEGPAGASVVQTISLAGSATSGPAFQGQFIEWFSDGSHFQTSIGTTVFTYLNTSELLNLTVLPSAESAQGLAGVGNWFWSLYAGLNVYQVGSSTPPVNFIPTGNIARVVITQSGSALAVVPVTGAQVTVVDLSGTTPSGSVQTLPFLNPTTYAATSPAQWFAGNGTGVLFDGTSPVTAPKYIALGAAQSIAGGGPVAAIATASGQIFTIDPQSGVIQNTIQSPANQLTMSSDGTVLTAALAPPNPFQPLTSLQIYSLPSATLIKDIGSENLVYGYSLAPSGTEIALTTPINSDTFQEMQQVTDLSSGDLIWSSTEYLSPVLFSPDATLIATPTATYADAGGQAITANIYLNGILIGAVPNVPVGWVDNNRLLVDNYESDSGCNCFAYTGSTLYSSTGIALASPALPALSRIQAINATSIYSPDYNAIYSLETGTATWTGTPPPGGTTEPAYDSQSLGAIAGAYAVVVFGTQVVAEPY